MQRSQCSFSLCLWRCLFLCFWTRRKMGLPSPCRGRGRFLRTFSLADIVFEKSWVQKCSSDSEIHGDFQQFLWRPARAPAHSLTGCWQVWDPEMSIFCRVPGWALKQWPNESQAILSIPVKQPGKWRPWDCKYLEARESQLSYSLGVAFRTRDWLPRQALCEGSRKKLPRIG